MSRAMPHAATLQTYAQFRPTGYDPRGLGLPDRQSWLVGPCSQTRDSGTLERSNFRSLVRELRALDPDGATWEVHRFGHWGPGWFEIILAEPESQAAVILGETDCALADYPVLCEEDWSALQWEEACEYWQRASVRTRVELLQATQLSIFAARRDELPEDPDGRLWEELTREN